MAAVIADLRTSTHNVSALQRTLRARGIHLNRRTLDRYLTGTGAYAGAAPAPARPGPAPSVPHAPAGQLDPLAEAVAEVHRIRSAQAQWLPTLGTEGASVRAYRALGEAHARALELVASLTPKANAEREAVLDAGTAERRELVARAGAAARVDRDLRGRYQRARQLLRLQPDLDTPEISDEYLYSRAPADIPPPAPGANTSAGAPAPPPLGAL